MLPKCQNAAAEQMITLCGDTESCPIFSEDIAIGKGSILSTRDTTGDYIIDGLISFSNVTLSRNADGNYNIDIDAYMNSISDADTTVRERIRNTLSGINREIQRRIDIMASSPELSMCINGRDMSQIRNSSSRTKNKNERPEDMTQARFPNLLNSYTNVIANAALEAAKANYDVEYAQLLSSALGASEEYKNRIYCNAMATGNNSDKSKLSNVSSGIKSANEWSIRLNGQSDKKMLDTLAANAESDNVITDTSGKMIARKTVTSTYDTGSQVCRITTTTYPCTGFEAIYNSEASSFSANASASFMGFGGGGGYSQSKSSTIYQGNFCSSYAEPVISEQVVNLASGNGNLYNTTTTRSNLQNYYNDQSSVTNQTNKSGGGFSLGLSTGDISNIGNGNTKNTTNNTTNVNSNNKTTTTNKK